MADSEFKPAFGSRLLAGVAVGILWYSAISVVVVAGFLLAQRVGSLPGIRAGAAIGLSLTLGAFGVGYYWSRRITSPIEETKIRVWTSTFIISFGSVLVLTSIIAAVAVSPDFVQLTIAYGGVHLVALTGGVITAQWRSRTQNTSDSNGEP
jgi:multisubunit Na+/H+ antiporter MnhC subunit